MPPSPPGFLHHGEQPLCSLPETGHPARDKIGSFMEASNVETWLNRWIQNYVNPNVDAGQDMKARFPLRESAGRSEGNSGQAGFVQRNRLSAAPGCRWRS